MKYLVHAVGGDELPAGCDQVIVERPDGPPLLIIKGSTARCWALMRAWEDTVEPAWQPSVTLPLRLVV